MLGGYIVLYPGRRVRVIWLYQILQVPAIVAIGIWFLFQLIAQAGTLGGEMGGVAYGAHIGGFVAGFLLVKLFETREHRALRRALSVSRTATSRRRAAS